MELVQKLSANHNLLYYCIFLGLDETEFARFAAGSVFIAVPIVLLYFCLVKNMVNGIADGAVKG